MSEIEELAISTAYIDYSLFKYLKKCNKLTLINIADIKEEYKIHSKIKDLDFTNSQDRIK